MKIANIYLLLVVIMGAILRFYNLDAQSFWLDEVFSVTSTGQDFQDYNNPPLSYVILWIFIETLGTNEFTARLPSCLFGVTTIPLVYLFGKQLLGEKEGLVASFVISVSPWHIRWSQEARMYTELTVFTILALYFFYQAAHKETLTFYLFSVMFSVLAFYTHFSAILIPLIMAFWLISTRFFDKTRPQINFGHLVIFVEFFFVLCAPSLFTHTPHILAGKLGGRDIRWGMPTIQDLVFKIFVIELGLILSLFTILGAFLIVSKRNQAGTLLVLYVAIPLLVFSLLVSRMNVVARYLIFTLPAYALLASYLLIEIIRKLNSEVYKRFHSNALKNVQTNGILSIGVLLGILLFVIPVIPSLSYYYEYGVHPDWRGACLFVEPQLEHTDVVTSTVPNTVEYYLGRVDFKLGEESFGRIKNSKWRVWLFIDDWKLDVIDPDHEFQDWMKSHCKLMHQAHRVEVYLFDPLENN